MTLWDMVAADLEAATGRQERLQLRGAVSGGCINQAQRIGYAGSVVVECTAAGPDPFTPVKGEGWRDEVKKHTADSLRLLKAYASVS